MLSPVRIACASIPIILLATSMSLAVAPPTTVALSGSLTASGGTYTLFSNPVLDANGRVGFNASLTGGTSTSGIFAGLPGAVLPVALQGLAAPSGGNYGTLYSSATTTSLSLNSAGQLAFLATLTGGTSTQGVFGGTQGLLTTVALKGDAAPGTGGGVFNVITATGINSASSPLLNSAGQVGFQSSLTGSTTPSTASVGIFTGTIGSPGSLQAVALVGQTAPGTGGAVYTTTVTSPVLNTNGQVAFLSLAGTNQALFVSGASGGAVQLIASQGKLTPDGNYIYGPMSAPQINGSGKVAFTSTVQLPSTNALYAGTVGAIQAVVLPGDSAPSTGGETFGQITNVTINGSGNIAFTAALAGGPAATGLFTGADASSLKLVALAGSADPDYSGATIAGFTSTELSNAVGQVVFLATLTPGVAGVVSGTNSVALLGGTPGNLVQLARQGDVIDVNPDPLITDNRTISGFGLLVGTGGQDGKGFDFNDNGLVAYRLTFTDGTSGIFTSTVPEPTALAMVALAGFGLRRRRSVAV